MKNVQKATKIPVEPRSDLSATLQAMRSWKCFVPVSGLECSYGKNSKNFQLGYRDLGRKNRDLGNRASPPSHMNTSKFLKRKEWRGEISETEPARSTGLIWRGPEKIYSETAYLLNLNSFTYLKPTAIKPHDMTGKTWLSKARLLQEFTFHKSKNRWNRSAKIYEQPAGNGRFYACLVLTQVLSNITSNSGGGKQLPRKARGKHITSHHN